MNISNIEIDFIKKSLEAALRIDGRDLLQSRNISIRFGLKEGEVELDWGDTRVFSRVKAELTEPKPERPSEGFLNFKVDLTCLGEGQSSANQKIKKMSCEISKILEKIIKGSKALDVESLCLLSGKVVWSVQVETILLNNDGNLIDSVYLASIIALLNYRKPFVSVENQNSIKLFDQSQRKAQPLSIHHIPISFTFAFFQDSNAIVADPSGQEEEIMDGRITIAMNIYRDICLIHKPGGAPLDPALISKILTICETKILESTLLIRNTLAASAQYNISDIKEKTSIKFMWSESLGLDSEDKSLWKAKEKEQEEMLVERNEEENKNKWHIDTNELIESLEKI